MTPTREVLSFWESCDPKVSHAGIEVRTGWKWSAAKAVEDAESWLRYRLLVGALSHGRASLGSINTPCYDKAQGKEQRALIQDGIGRISQGGASWQDGGIVATGNLDKMGASCGPLILLD